MPLTPRLLVVVGPRDGSRAIHDEEVDAYNEMQVHEARDYVIHRPGAQFAASTGGVASLTGRQPSPHRALGPQGQTIMQGKCA